MDDLNSSHNRTVKESINMSHSYINVIGAGLAGSEAAYQIAERGIPVKLYEMRGVKSTPQHKTDNFAELVCSNSLRGDALTNAVGLLKEEMRCLGSIILESAEATRVPAGGALAVDRDGFSQRVTEKIANHPLIEVVRDEITELTNRLFGGDHIFIMGGYNDRHFWIIRKRIRIDTKITVFEPKMNS